MANKINAMGLDAELAKKQDSKYDVQLETEAIDWIEKLTGKKSPGPKDQFQQFLKDGQVLCELVNSIVPGCVPKINQSSMPFKQMENIGNFLNACTKALNMKPIDLFQTADLFDNKNMVQVILTIHGVGRAAGALNYNGPVIGAKLAEKNERNFDESVLNAGKAIPSQQMGNNEGASLAGHTAPGTRRNVMDERRY